MLTLLYDISYYDTRMPLLFVELCAAVLLACGKLAARLCYKPWTIHTVLDLVVLLMHDK